jgi:hypothetical protein
VSGSLAPVERSLHPPSGSPPRAIVTSFPESAPRQKAIRLNIEAETGPTTLVTTADRELEALLLDPHLGPLVRWLSPYSESAAL